MKVIIRNEHGQHLRCILLGRATLFSDSTEERSFAGWINMLK